MNIPDQLALRKELHTILHDQVLPVFNQVNEQVTRRGGKSEFETAKDEVDCLDGSLGMLFSSIELKITMPLMTAATWKVSGEPGRWDLLLDETSREKPRLFYRVPFDSLNANTIKELTQTFLSQNCGPHSHADSLPFCTVSAVQRFFYFTPQASIRKW